MTEQTLNSKLKTEFESVAIEHLPRLYRLAYMRLGSREDAEDVVQETFLKAFRAFSARRDGNVQAWLTAILLNTLRDHVRKDARVASAHLDQLENDDRILSIADKRPDPEQQLAAKELDAELSAALESTPEWLLTPFLLREIQDLSYKEIAKVLAIPIGTVMSRLSRARQHLCSKLGGKPDKKPQSAGSSAPSSPASPLAPPPPAALLEPPQSITPTTDRSLPEAEERQ